ncbi:MAG: amidophosphoribosyltransferase, partial [Steroidobacteraceae bacterium]
TLFRSVRDLIGADWLVYQDLDDLVLACQHDDARVSEFDTSCFSGTYVTGDVTREYLERLRSERSDAAKAHRRVAQSHLKVVSGV